MLELLNEIGSLAKINYTEVLDMESYKQEFIESSRNLLNLW